MPAESRTPDTQIKSLLLYLLSYGHIYGLFSRESSSLTKKFLYDITIFFASTRLEKGNTIVDKSEFEFFLSHNKYSFRFIMIYGAR